MSEIISGLSVLSNEQICREASLNSWTKDGVGGATDWNKKINK